MSNYSWFIGKAKNPLKISNWNKCRLYKVSKKSCFAWEYGSNVTLKEARELAKAGNNNGFNKLSFRWNEFLNWYELTPVKGKDE